MATISQMRHAAVVLTTMVVIASCTSAPASPSPTVCDGVSSEVGGCTAERHEFTGTTCAGLATEWASVLDGAVRGVLRGPDVVAEQGRSVLLRQALVITTVDMNARLRGLGLQSTCDLPEFMAVAEPVFSAELRAGVGNALYDGNPPATYDEWLQDVQKVARVIDAED